MTKMRAIVVTKNRGVQSKLSREWLVLDSTSPMPEVARGEVRIKVSHAGITRPNLLVACGMHPLRPQLPFIAGADGSGWVDALGDGVAGFTVGQPVIFRQEPGAMAEFVSVPARYVWPIPAAFDMAQAACFLTNFATAHMFLNVLANVRKDQIVVVLGASGGVGLAACSIARLAGARVIAIVGTAKKEPLVAAMGAHHIVNYTANVGPEKQAESYRTQVEKIITESYAGRRASIIFDPLGGKTQEMLDATRALLAPLGVWCAVGYIAGGETTIPFGEFVKTPFSVLSARLTALREHEPEKYSTIMRGALELAETGDTRHQAHNVFAMENYFEAFNSFVQPDAAGGNIVIKIGEK